MVTEKEEIKKNNIACAYILQPKFMHELYKINMHANYLQFRVILMEINLFRITKKTQSDVCILVISCNVNIMMLIWGRDVV